MANANEYVLKCNQLPILINIEGNGCIEIWNDGFNNKNVICGPGQGVITNIKVGIVKLYSKADEGFELTNLMGLPKNKSTRLNKPYFEFYYSKEYFNPTTKTGKMIEITAKFKPIAGYSMPPAGNILGL